MTKQLRKFGVNSNTTPLPLFNFFRESTMKILAHDWVRFCDYKEGFFSKMEDVYPERKRVIKRKTFRGDEVAKQKVLEMFIQSGESSLDIPWEFIAGTGYIDWATKWTDKNAWKVLVKDPYNKGKWKVEEVFLDLEEAREYAQELGEAAKVCQMYIRKLSVETETGQYAPVYIYKRLKDNKHGRYYARMRGRKGGFRTSVSCHKLPYKNGVREVAGIERVMTGYYQFNKKIMGYRKQTTTCSTCGGTGMIQNCSCYTCKGNGFLNTGGCIKNHKEKNRYLKCPVCYTRFLYRLDDDVNKKRICKKCNLEILQYEGLPLNYIPEELEGYEEETEKGRLRQAKKQKKDEFTKKDEWNYVPEFNEFYQPPSEITHDDDEDIPF